MMLNSPKRGGGLYEPLADINVTPLVDVMLVLLIVFMIAAPMLTTGMRVSLPQARTAKGLDAKEPVIVTVTKDARLFIGRDEVARGELVQTMQAKVGDDTGRAIYVRGDREVVYGEVVAVMDQLALNGFGKISLLTSGVSGTSADRATPVSGR